eukprot:1942520-Prymnesium_polylepis.1
MPSWSTSRVRRGVSVGRGCGLSMGRAGRAVVRGGGVGSGIGGGRWYGALAWGGGMGGGRDGGSGGSPRTCMDMQPVPVQPSSMRVRVRERAYVRVQVAAVLSRVRDDRVHL